MGLWEEQIKRTDHDRRLWSEAQEFSFIDALLNANNEEEVKAAYVKEFSLPVKTQERHDLVVDKVLFEFKYSVKLSNIEVAAKVIAQAIYYINRLFKKGRLNEAKYLVVADKDEVRLFRVIEFQPFYESNEYEWDSFRPSSPDPKLVEAIKNSRILESNRIYKLTSQEDLHLFSSCLYKLLSPNKTIQKPRRSRNLIKQRFLIAGLGVFLILLSSVFIVSQYHSIHTQQPVSGRKE